MPMSSLSQARIREAVERVCSVLGKRPGYGRETTVTVSTVTDGLACRTEEGRWSFDTDLPRGLGGSALAPTPGVLVRAALSSCLATGYALRAAMVGVEVVSVRVTVEGDSEVAGMLLLDADAPPGYTGLRYHVEVESPCSEDEVRAVVDGADRLSPLLDVFTRPNELRRTLTVRPRPARAVEA